jgi:hypothetical protein
MRWILPFALAGLAAFGTAELEVFDFGELDQYNPKEVGCPIANSILAVSMWAFPQTSRQKFKVYWKAVDSWTTSVIRRPVKYYDRPI